tara:strand:+ start:1043 stop:1216 length:174 start_codon:yes stop_codon:yes gene_type:complete
MKKILVPIFILFSLSACETVKEKTSGLKIKDMGSGIAKECPPKEERTLKHIFCREPK